MIKHNPFFGVLLCMLLAGCVKEYTLPDPYYSYPASSPAFEKVFMKDATDTPFPADVALCCETGNNRQDLLVTTTWGDFLGLMGPGKQDGTVAIFRGTDKEKAFFSKGYEFNAGEAAGSVALVRQDSDVMVAVAAMNSLTRQRDGSIGHGEIWTFFVRSTGFSQGPRIPSPVANPRSIQIANISCDYLPDIVIGSLSDEDHAVGLLINQGNDRFEPRKIGKMSGQGWPVHVADLRNKGRKDIVVLNSQTIPLKVWRIVILLNNGDDTFDQRDIPVSGKGQPYSLAIGDWNGDGKLDIAVSTESAILLFAGDGEGNFRQDKEIDGTFAPGRLSIADLNGDGWPDIIAPTRLDELAIFWGGKNGQITGRTKLSLKSSSLCSKDDPDLSMYPVVSYAIGDIDGDGRPDIVIPATASDFAKAYQDRAASLQDPGKGLDTHGYLVIFRNRIAR